jgi:hypothetical protein
MARKSTYLYFLWPVFLYVRRVSVPTRQPDGTSKNELRDMFQYEERDVERVAWRKHGGPDGFTA